jgi:hypothetical protein
LSDDRNVGEPLSDDRDSRQPSRDLGGPGERRIAGREQLVRLLAGRISAAVGLLFAAGGLVAAFLGGGANVSTGAVGAVLGVVGYFLGSRRLGTAAVILCVAVLFFGLAASQGLIPGIDASDRNLPAREPAAE